VVYKSSLAIQVSRESGRRETKEEEKVGFHLDVVARMRR
jgi:hypothetical protein